MTTNRTDVLFFPTKYHAQRNTRFSHSASVCLFFSNDTFFQKNLPPIFLSVYFFSNYVEPCTLTKNKVMYNMNRDCVWFDSSLSVR